MANAELNGTEEVELAEKGKPSTVILFGFMLVLAMGVIGNIYQLNHQLEQGEVNKKVLEAHFAPKHETVLSFGGSKSFDGYEVTTDKGEYFIVIEDEKVTSLTPVPKKKAQ